MKLSLEETQHIANLARLQLTADELARFQEQLSAILDHFATLKTLDTSNISPTRATFASSIPMREDRSRPGLLPDNLFCNAPQVEQGQFRVPPVFE